MTFPASPVTSYVRFRIVDATVVANSGCHQCLFQDGKFSRRMEVWHGVVLAALASWHCTLLTRYYLRRSR